MSHLSLCMLIKVSYTLVTKYLSWLRAILSLVNDKNSYFIRIFIAFPLRNITEST